MNSGATAYGPSPQFAVGSGAGADAVRVARPWPESVSRFDPIAAMSPDPQIGAGAASAGRARCTTGGGSQIVWESDGEENNPAKT